jgi:histidyl-tRNA synthetase
MSATTTPSLPQGTRDFDAVAVRKRNHIFNTIKSVFERYGFEPLETPALENLTTLTGKYGEEGDQLMYKVLNNGISNPKNADKAREGFEKAISGKSSPLLTERALRYDLTIPFARYVAMNHGKLTLPLRRYQIQPVWRGDSPQKGRYREFTQCDADIVGSRSLMNEAELVLICRDVFGMLGLDGYRLCINNRKILTALAEVCGAENQSVAITTAIDKLDKIGLDKVCAELATKGLNTGQIDKVRAYLDANGNTGDPAENPRKIAFLEQFFEGNPNGMQGIAEINELTRLLPEGLPLQIDLTLARGLTYYTGAIFEAKAPASVKIGSIGGGGRYDDLTGLFGVPGIPGVGISFGVDRIFDVLTELDLFPENISQGTTVLFFNLGQQESEYGFSIMQALRGAGISAEMFHEPAKMGKQFNYAEKKNIPFAAIIGSREMEEQACLVKELATGEQQKIPVDRLAAFFLSRKK